MGEVVWTPAQKEAIDSRGYSIAVSAAAGSGKTAVLTNRIIERVCAEDGDISRILVVTFTKAAAAELVSRIADALSKKLAENTENAHIRKQSLLVSSAQISTIHSFCLDLIRTNFQKLNIPPDFSAGDEAEINLMMSEIAEELIEDYFEGTLAPDEEAIEDFGAFADLFGDVARTDQLSKTLISLYLSVFPTVDSLDRIEHFRALAEKAAKDGFDGTPWELCAREYLLQLLSHYSRIYEDAVQRARSDKKFAKPLAQIAFEWDEIEKLRTSLEKGIPYREIYPMICSLQSAFGKLTGISGDMHLKTFMKKFRSDFKDHLKKIAPKYYSYSEESLKACFIATEEAMRKLGCFLRTFDKRFSEEKKRRKVITFNDMELFAFRLLYDKDKNAPTELALSLRDAYDEIYIDEYQDTNELQDTIFRLISKENNRFNVGDIKQSIYSFRGAKPDIFSELLDSRPKYRDGMEENQAKIFLSQNFRSSTEILEFCNGVFDKLMNAKEVRYGEDERLYPGRGLHTAVPEMYLIPKTSSNSGNSGDDEAEEMIGEADFVASKIEFLLKNETKADGTPLKCSDIVILLRSTSNAAKAYEDALTARGIPCKNSGDKEFFESPEVLLIVSLLGAIDNPARDIYLAAALKSPIYGVTLDELIFIRRSLKEGSLFDALRAFTKETGFAKGQKFLDDYEKYALLSAETPCDALIWEIYNDTGIFSAIASDESLSMYEIEQANANLMTLYNYARGFERGGFKGLSGFIAFINDVLARRAQMDISGFASPGDVVNIMTIHKSKGLEFPICFLCNLGKKMAFPESKEKTVYHSDFGISLKLTAEHGMVRLDTPLREIALLDKKRALVEEELRVLYVALTRPKERLYMTASVNAKNLSNGDYELWRDDCVYAWKNKYFSEFDLREPTTYLELLLTAMADHTDSFLMDIVSDSADGDDTPADADEANAVPTETNEEEPTDMTYYEAKKLVSERLDYTYPYRRLSEIPSKLSVSELYPTILDEADRGAELSEDVDLTMTVPNFLLREKDETVTAAQKGTAMHTFMQFCDFDRVLKNGVSAEIDYLASKRFIFEADKEKMDVRRLEAFFQSTLAEQIMASDEVFREKRFMIKFPANLFTEDSSDIPENEKILVQGVIDCAFIDGNGELILVDYKTDFFSKGTSRAFVEKTLRARHSRQLGYYKLACETMFGKLPAHTYIYSFALNDTVEI